MKTLNIQFTHPVKGRVQLRKKGSRNVETSQFKTDKDFFVELDTSTLTAGEWTACFEWNYDNQPFFIEKHFKIKDQKINPLSSKGSAPTEPAVT